MSFSLSCVSPIYLKSKNLLVPCGKCLICRRKYQLSWVVRLQHEFISSKYQAIFLTLSYNNENLPLNSTLVKKDVQDFLKRLRKRYPSKKLKYFAVGEYGSNTMRPHYHLIIFGLKSYNTPSLNVKLSNSISKNIWKKGFCHVGQVNIKTIRYCSKYVMKEFVKGYSRDDFDKSGMIYPFSLKSTGLGLKYFMDNLDYIKEQILNNRPISLFRAKCGYPRYYRKKLVDLGLIDENLFMNNYKDYMNSLEPTIISELKELGYNIDNNYPNISLFSYFNIENEYKLKREEKNITLPRRYKSDIPFSQINFVPYTDYEIDDIKKNHWFTLYKQHYYVSVYKKQLKNLNYNWKDSDYE